MLLEEFGEAAYKEARRRARIERLDGVLGDRPLAHRENVWLEVRRCRMASMPGDANVKPRPAQETVTGGCTPEAGNQKMRASRLTTPPKTAFISP